MHSHPLHHYSTPCIITHADRYHPVTYPIGPMHASDQMSNRAAMAPCRACIPYKVQSPQPHRVRLLCEFAQVRALSPWVLSDIPPLSLTPWTGLTRAIHSPILRTHASQWAVCRRYVRSRARCADSCHYLALSLDIPLCIPYHHAHTRFLSTARLHLHPPIRTHVFIHSTPHLVLTPSD